MEKWLRDALKLAGKTDAEIEKLAAESKDDIVMLSNTVIESFTAAMTNSKEDVIKLQSVVSSLEEKIKTQMVKTSPEEKNNVTLSAYSKYLKEGATSLNEMEKLALNPLPGNTGQYMIPEIVMAELFTTVNKLNDFLAMATVLPVPEGVTSIHVPYDDSDTALPVTGTEVYVTDYDNMDKESFILQDSTEIVKVFEDIVNFSPDFVAFLINSYLEKINAGSFVDFITGDGINKPTGILKSGKAVKFDVKDLDTMTDAELLEMVIDATYTVPSKYRNKLDCGFIIPTDVLKKIDKANITVQNPLFDRENNTINGYKFIECDNQYTNEKTGVVTNTFLRAVPGQFTTDDEILIFGNMKKYMAAIRKPVLVRTLNEKYAEESKIGYMFRGSRDGAVLVSNAFSVAIVE